VIPADSHAPMVVSTTPPWDLPTPKLALSWAAPGGRGELGDD
jgi:hypothetical protein